VSTVIWTAWVGDDAFITLRTVDNALHGHGLRWNVGERVQAYTHPLWMFLTLGATWLIGSAYHAVTWLSIACSAAAAALVIGRLATGAFASMLATLLFATSLAFRDYSTSGLENPLTHLLIAAFVLVWSNRPSTPRRTFWLATIVAAIMLNRLDAGLLVLPAFGVAGHQRPFGRHLAAAALGFVPLLAWEAFSVIYYGFAFPNTAYAKLSTGISAGRLLAQGAYYYLDLLRTDVVTLAAIVAALGLTASGARRPLWPLSLGIALYLAYILRIGGDFMAGRFFAAPFFLAVIVLARGTQPSRWSVRAGVILLVLAARALQTPAAPEIVRAHGITDQRLLYSESTRLVTQRASPVERGSAAQRGIAMRDKGVRVVELGMIGMAGFYAGPSVHIVDPYALSDPLLARLPADPNSRIGHFARRVPPGYLLSLRRGTNEIEYPRIARYYDDLVLITRGPIWSRDRWRAILRLNTVDRTI
jgi:arabinofuranosyltransferase